jgi:RNA polymerase primary sigma factor
MYWIRAAVKRSQIYQSRVITVPQRLYENHKKLLRIEKEYMATRGRRPTYKELSDASNLSENQVARCMTAMQQQSFSLDQSIQNKLKPNSGDPEQDSLHEIVTSRTDDGEYAKIRRLFVREDLIETLERHLDEEEVDLILLRYGLKRDENLPAGYQDKPLTIAEVSRVVGLKPDKVRRTIHKALKELKRLIGDEWRDFERQLE